MIKDEPIARASKHLEKRFEQSVRDSLAQAGRIARVAGLSIERCPPFSDPDMGCLWRIGWNHADELIKSRRPKNNS